MRYRRRTAADVAEALDHQHRAKTATYLRLEVEDRIARGIYAAEQRIKEGLAAIQAIDWGLRDKGFLIVLTHVGESPRVHVREIPPNMRHEHYREMIRELEGFGIKLTHFDAPPMLRAMLEEDRRRGG